MFFENFEEPHNFEKQNSKMAVVLVCVQSLIFGSHIAFG
jgi:hypothetical protein